MSSELSLFPMKTVYFQPKSSKIQGNPSKICYILAPKYKICARLFSQLVKAFDLIPSPSAQTRYSFVFF